MDFLIILIDLVVIALGIVDVRFGFICRREQHQNKMNAQIYVGDGKIVWIFGLISWVAGILEMILLLVSFNELAFYIWLLICIMAQWGMTAFLWQHYCYSAVYLYGKKIYFFDKRRKRNIGLENKVGIKAALGNTVYAFFDENDNKYSKWNKKSFADWYKCSENRYYNSDRNNYLFNVYNWSDLHLCICKS